jgi:hypothetical protein
MISFALAQELKNAGFSPSKNTNAVYFINDHLKIRREDALRMWYGDKSRIGLDLDLSKEVVYSPTLTELIGACGVPFYGRALIQATGLRRTQQMEKGDEQAKRPPKR